MGRARQRPQGAAPRAETDVETDARSTQRGKQQDQLDPARFIFGVDVGTIIMFIQNSNVIPYKLAVFLIATCKFR